MKKILVTGGAGYIGIHICLLLEQEFDVVIVDSLTNSNENSIKSYLIIRIKILI